MPHATRWWRGWKTYYRLKKAEKADLKKTETVDLNKCVARLRRKEAKMGAALAMLPKSTRIGASKSRPTMLERYAAVARARKRGRG